MESQGSSKPYLITFKPINRFFFGSSYSLGEGFYAKSLKFPQPTTVLGCIRNTILAQNNLIEITKIPQKDFLENNEAVKQFTGTSKIETLSDSDDNFGVVERISPVFLIKQAEGKIEDTLFHVPADVVQGERSFLTCYEYEKKEGSAKSSYSGRKINYAILFRKQPKSVNANYYGGRSFWDAYLNKKLLPYDPAYEEDNIFSTYKNVGIERENRKAKTGAFYFKIEYSLRDGFSFGLVIWLKSKNGEDAPLKDGIVILGGERSTFSMKVSLVTRDLLSNPVMERIINGKCDLIDNLSNCTNKEKLIALSPVILDEQSSNGFAKAMEHRIINGLHSIRTVKRANGKEKSEAARMIPAGSIFYPSCSISLSFNWVIPYKIGYNYALRI